MYFLNPKIKAGLKIDAWMRFVAASDDIKQCKSATVLEFDRCLFVSLILLCCLGG